MTIKIHTEQEFEKMRSAGRLAAHVLDYITDFVQPGVTTNRLNQLCHDLIISSGATPAPLGYRGFPKSICTSINHVICHGIPSEDKLKDGDIVNIDVTVILDGYHGDSSRMYLVGNPSIKARRLVDMTYEALMIGINQVKPGNRIGDIGHAIQTFAESNNYSIVTDYCGHGLGQEFHAEPNVPHYGKPGTGDLIREGMFFTIEPMLNAGKAESKLSPFDGWTVTTRDRSLSAQFEHSIGVTKDGCEIFTLSPRGYTKPPY